MILATESAFNLYLKRAAAAGNSTRITMLKWKLKLTIRRHKIVALALVRCGNLERETRVTKRLIKSGQMEYQFPNYD